MTLRRTSPLVVLAALLVLTVPGPVGLRAAGALVEQDSAHDSVNDTSMTATLDDITAGNLLVAVFGAANAANDITSIQDDCGNTFAEAVSIQHSTQNAFGAIYYKENAAGSATTCTVTVTLTGNMAQKTLVVSEWSGMATSSALDQVNSADELGVVTPWPYPTTPPTVTTTTADQVVIAGVYADANQNPYSNPTNSFTLFTLAGQRMAASYRIVSTTGTYSTSATGTTNGDDVSVIASFKADGGGGGPDPSAPCLLTLVGVGC